MFKYVCDPGKGAALSHCVTLHIPWVPRIQLVSGWVSVLETLSSLLWKIVHILNTAHPWPQATVKGQVALSGQMSSETSGKAFSSYSGVLIMRHEWEESGSLFIYCLIRWLVSPSAPGVGLVPKPQMNTSPGRDREERVTVKPHDKHETRSFNNGEPSRHRRLALGVGETTAREDGMYKIDR